MSNIAVRKRRHTTTELAAFTPAKGEYFVDVTKPSLVVGDGTTAGGIPLAHEVHTHPNATESVAGFMSATDKTKLDNLAAATGIQVIQNSGSDMPAESTLNFDGDFTLTDDPSHTRTNVAMSTTFLNTINSNSVALIIALS